MAVGAVARGDLVVVHAPRFGSSGHGLFIVDTAGAGAFGANTVTVLPLDDVSALAGGVKSKALVLDKTADILAVHTSSSISA
jgi:hypothetical protein